ncbi:host attachment protein [Arsenicitalea aurantiaca]|uniref:Host attachment protein n=1 Tax=Arsenicitalea aurantiaca TaxID=1783274 RepID=A0A433XM21_9HYPH|nr:host attachment protein [Arsenicitalea aurantiaca]RUT35103.1 host attachment protein [Arsenicitalea aurantiaca]
MKKTVTWFLIADGAQARVLENTGPGKGLRQVGGLDFGIEPLQGRDIVTDRPGRRADTGPGQRSAMEPRTDPVEQRETAFVKSMADMIEQKRAEGAFDRLVIAAAPTALGVIRPHLSDGVRKTLLAEVPKDLTNIPTDKLGTHFEDVMAI